MLSFFGSLCLDRVRGNPFSRVQSYVSSSHVLHGQVGKMLYLVLSKWSVKDYNGSSIGKEWKAEVYLR
jgi:hypothetical protein